MDNDGEKPVNGKRKSRRRWFRYRLRALFGLTLLVAVLLGVYRHFAVPHRERQKFVADAAKLGADLKIRPWNSSEVQEWNNALQFGLWDQIEEVDLFGRNTAGWRRFENDQLTEPMDFKSGGDAPDFEHLVDLIQDTIALDSWSDPTGSTTGTPNEKQEAWLACLQRLRYLPGLKRLSLRGGALDDAEAVYLRGLKHLEHLELRAAEISDAGLVHLRGLTDLETLDLGWTQISDDGIDTLNELTSLRHLYLDHTKVSHAHFKGIRRLVYLNLVGAPVTSIQFDNADNLRALNLRDTNLPDSALRELSKLKKLLRLSLHGTRVKGEGTEHLSRLPRLEELSLDSRAINEQSLKHLRKIKNLKVLHVYFISAEFDDSKADALLNLIRKTLPQSVTIHEFFSFSYGFEDWP